MQYKNKRKYFVKWRRYVQKILKSFHISLFASIVRLYIDIVSFLQTPPRQKKILILPSSLTYNMYMPHHFIVRIDKVSAPMTVSPCLDLRPVRHEPLVVVDRHLGLGVLTTRQYHNLL